MSSLNSCFTLSSSLSSDDVAKFLLYVKSLGYHERPDYQKLKELLGSSDKGKLDFSRPQDKPAGRLTHSPPASSKVRSAGRPLKCLSTFLSFCCHFWVHGCVVATLHLQEITCQLTGSSVSPQIRCRWSLTFSFAQSQRLSPPSSSSPCFHDLAVGWETIELYQSVISSKKRDTCLYRIATYYFFKC